MKPTSRPEPKPFISISILVSGISSLPSESSTTELEPLASTQCHRNAERVVETLALEYAVVGIGSHTEETLSMEGHGKDQRRQRACVHHSPLHREERQPCYPTRIVCSIDKLWSSMPFLSGMGERRGRSGRRRRGLWSRISRIRERRRWLYLERMKPCFGCGCDWR
jgi:hypothetical protein